MALPKRNRLVGKKDIGQVFKNGRTVKGSSLFIRFLNGSHPEGHSRFTLIVPVKHIRFAVDRNRIRRILSGGIVIFPSLLSRGLNIIVSVSKKVPREKFGSLAGELKELLLILLKTVDDQRQKLEKTVFKNNSDI